MKHVTQFILLALIAFLFACTEENGSSVAGNDGGISGTGDGSDQLAMSGSVYKGPLSQGSTITLRQVINGVVAVDEISTHTLSNKGDYELKVGASDVNGVIVSITATGQFYDENTAMYSSDSVELKALVKINSLADKPQIIYINSLTHLAHDIALQFIVDGKSYEEAMTLAQARVLEWLKPLTGTIETTQDFSNMSLINTQDTNEADNSFVLYLSALLTQATQQKQQQEPTFTTQDLFTMLIADVRNNVDLNDDILALLQASHGELDALVITQNLEAILVDETITSSAPTIDSITPGMSSPEDFTTAMVSGTSKRRFCYDGATDCGAPTVSGEVTSNGLYTYELQTSADSDFPFARGDSTSVNHFSVDEGRFATGTTYARVRKKWQNGQYSEWVELSFVTP